MPEFLKLLLNPLPPKNTPRPHIYICLEPLTSVHTTHSTVKKELPKFISTSVEFRQENRGKGEKGGKHTSRIETPSSSHQKLNLSPTKFDRSDGDFISMKMRDDSTMTYTINIDIHIFH